MKPIDAQVDRTGSRESTADGMAISSSEQRMDVPQDTVPDTGLNQKTVSVEDEIPIPPTALTTEATKKIENFRGFYRAVDSMVRRHGFDQVPERFLEELMGDEPELLSFGDDGQENLGELSDDDTRMRDEPFSGKDILNAEIEILLGDKATEGNSQVSDIVVACASTIMSIAGGATCGGGAAEIVNCAASLLGSVLDDSKLALELAANHSAESAANHAAEGASPGLGNFFHMISPDEPFPQFSKNCWAVSADSSLPEKSVKAGAEKVANIANNPAEKKESGIVGKALGKVAGKVSNQENWENNMGRENFKNFYNGVGYLVRKYGSDQVPPRLFEKIMDGERELFDIGENGREQWPELSDDDARTLDGWFTEGNLVELEVEILKNNFRAEVDRGESAGMERALAISAAVVTTVAAVAGTIATFGAGAGITVPVAVSAIGSLLMALKTDVELGSEMRKSYDRMEHQ